MEYNASIKLKNVSEDNIFQQGNMKGFVLKQDVKFVQSIITRLKILEENKYKINRDCNLMR